MDSSPRFAVSVRSSLIDGGTTLAIEVNNREEWANAWRFWRIVRASIQASRSGYVMFCVPDQRRKRVFSRRHVMPLAHSRPDQLEHDARLRALTGRTLRDDLLFAAENRVISYGRDKVSRHVRACFDKYVNAPRREN